MELETLLARLPRSTRVIGSRERTVTALAIDSREAVPGALFIALRGEHTDGHRFVSQAVERGAVAALVEEALAIDGNVTQILVPDTARAASHLADAFYGSPSQHLSIAGVTGTNGKTTTTHMVASMLEGAGMACGIIGTVGASLHERAWTLQHTTPMAPQLHAILAQMREDGARAVAMEVSSHALALQRVADVRFAVGALTNITRDHLDFHGTFEAYAAAKRRLFDLAPAAVLNADDPMGARFAGELQSCNRVTTYAIDAAADIRPQSLEMTAAGSSFAVGKTRFTVHLPGKFNVANALCALGVVRALSVSDGDAARGLERLRSVRGRMEHVREGGIDAIVDYAHTPDALEHVLRAAREVTRGRVIAVFGCGGDRDRGKRPQMGAVAARLADYTFVTSDNPRTEDPEAIARAILEGIGNAPHALQLDRRAAIASAVREAREGDVVVIAGKGHENYQIVGHDVLPFDDVEVTRAAIASRTVPAP